MYMYIPSLPTTTSSCTSMLTLPHAMSNSVRQNGTDPPQDLSESARDVPANHVGDYRTETGTKDIGRHDFSCPASSCCV
jgi:hypothetical protein